MGRILAQEVTAMIRGAIWMSTMAVVWLTGCGGRESATGRATSCNENGAVHANGTTWTCSDGCNTCSCSNGQIASTLIACALGGPEGGADKDADAEADVCMNVDPAAYDQSCTVDTDCAVVSIGLDTCVPTCRCGGLATVNTKAQTHYNADLALARSLPSIDLLCPCAVQPPIAGPCCVAGTCNVFACGPSPTDSGSYTEAGAGWEASTPGWDGGACLATQPAVTMNVVADLAKALWIPISQVLIVCTEETSWPDGCLGLPAPELCAPGPVPGYLIVLRALGKEYEYRADVAGLWGYAGPACGTQTCGPRQLCAYLYGIGPQPLCTTTNDAGACSDGFTYTLTCPNLGNRPGCNPPISPPSPMGCVNIPASCGATPTCGCFPTTVCPYGPGSCLGVTAQSLTCGAQ